MRELHGHKVNECNDVVKIEVKDEPGAGGANHYYEVSYPDAKSPECRAVHGIYFQNGPIKEVGTNGLTHEILLTIVADRLESFQKGPYMCRENAIALTKIQEATMWLQKRTRDRLARGVEGTHEK